MRKFSYVLSSNFMAFVLCKSNVQVSRLFCRQLHPHLCSHSDLIFAVTDRLSTGIAVADIDFSFIESIRTKMPIEKVFIGYVDFCFVEEVTDPLGGGVWGGG